MPDVSLVCKRW